MPSKRRLAVIGAGPAGLFAAHLARAEGFEVTLFEGHSKPGGSASYFRRKTEMGDVTFDAGATLVGGLAPDGYLRRLMGRIGVEAPPCEPVRTMHYRIRGRSFALDATSPETWTESLARVFPKDATLIHGLFPRLARRARRLQRALEGVPHLPLECAQDLRLNAALAPSLVPLLPEFLWGHFHHFGQELDALGARPELRRWIDMNLLITLQAPSHAVPPLWAAMALMFYPLGVGAPAGGLKAFFEPLLDKLKSDPGARVFMKCPVSRIEEGPEGFWIEGADGRVGPFDWVISSAPRYDSARLCAFPAFAPDDRWEKLRPELWGATVGYFAVVDSPALPEEAFHVHSSDVAHFEEAADGGDIYLSFSARGDAKRSPTGVRALTLSTHARLEAWADIPESRGPDGKALYRADPGYLARKAAAGKPLGDALRRLFPELRILHEEYGSPPSFWRYTRRRGGSVGGLPLTLGHTGLRAPSPRTRHPRFLQIGDTSFPGQSVFACAVGAVAAVEKMTGRKFRLRG